MELNSSHKAVFGYIYKVILSDNTYWILSCTQKLFRKKCFLKENILKIFLKLNLSNMSLQMKKEKLFLKN